MKLKVFKAELQKDKWVEILDLPFNSDEYSVGHPTLRLVRVAVGPFTLRGLAPGQWRRVDPGLLASRPAPGRDRGR